MLSSASYPTMSSRPPLPSVQPPLPILLSRASPPQMAPSFLLARRATAGAHTATAAAPCGANAIAPNGALAVAPACSAAAGPSCKVLNPTPASVSAPASAPASTSASVRAAASAAASARAIARARATARASDTRCGTHFHVDEATGLLRRAASGARRITGILRSGGRAVVRSAGRASASRAGPRGGTHSPQSAVPQPHAQQLQQ